MPTLLWLILLALQCARSDWTAFLHSWHGKQQVTRQAAGQQDAKERPLGPLAPVLDLQRAQFLRERVNDLPALAAFAAQTRRQVVVCSIYNSIYHELSVNFFYALWRFGHVTEVLLASHDERSLAQCLALGFACFNASAHVPASQAEGFQHPAEFIENHTLHYQLMQTKPRLISALLDLNFTVLFSDLDTVWVKDAVRSFAAAAAAHGADIVGMEDQGMQGLPPSPATGSEDFTLNAGNLYLLPNARVKRLVRVWIALGVQNGELRGDKHDQHLLSWLRNRNRAWASCNSTAACAAVRASGSAAAWLHPWQGCPAFHLPEHHTRLCGREFAYLHLLCTSAGVAKKRLMAQEVGLWFLKSDRAGDQPRDESGGGTQAVGEGERLFDLVDFQERHVVREGPTGYSLPCPSKPAFEGL